MYPKKHEKTGKKKKTYASKSDPNPSLGYVRNFPVVKSSPKYIFSLPKTKEKLYNCSVNAGCRTLPRRIAPKSN